MINSLPTCFRHYDVSHVALSFDIEFVELMNLITMTSDFQNNKSFKECSEK